MSGIDDAAAAFSADMGGKPAPRTQDSSEMPETMGVEDVFARRAHENDVTAGGDDTPAEGEVPERRTRQPRKVVTDQEYPDEPEVEEDPLYADDPEDGKNKEEDEKGDDDEEDEKGNDDEEVDLDPDLEVEVVVDGKEKKVTLREALDGYIRTETLHQRLNELNEVKTVMRNEAQTIISEREQVTALLTQLEEDMTALIPQEPDWDKLFAEDPAKARALQKSFDEYKGKVEELKAKRDEQTAKLKDDQLKQTKGFATSEREKFDNLPENRHWVTDPVEKEKDLKAMVRTAKGLGFTNAEIGGTLDSRMLALLLRASKYDRMTANRPKLAPQGKKNAKPGAGNGQRVRTAQRGLGRAQQQLARTGSVDDAAAVFKNVLKL